MAFLDKMKGIQLVEHTAISVPKRFLLLLIKAIDMLNPVGTDIEQLLASENILKRKPNME